MAWSRWRLRPGAPEPAPEPEVPAVPWPDAPAAGAASAEPEAPLRDGAAWIEGGRVLVREPRGRGRWPSIAIDPRAAVEVRINDQVCAGVSVLRTGDVVVLLPAEQMLPAQVEVELEPEGGGAWVTVRPGERITSTVPDSEPAVQLVLISIEQRETLPHGLTGTDVREAIEAAGGAPALDAAAVARALESPGRRVQVAAGRDAPRGPAVWTVVHGELSSPGAAAEHGAATARPTVEVGQPVAQLAEPAAPAGTPGLWRPTLEAGPGVLLSGDLRTAIASSGGHPEVSVDEERVYAAVYPERRVAGDAGEIDFAGDVWIDGGVLPGGTVRAAGGVEVRGKVVRGRIQAQGSVRLMGGVTHSVVLAGGPGLTYARALPACTLVLRLLEELTAGTGDPAQHHRELAAVCRRLLGVLAEADATLDPELTELERVLPAAAHWASLEAPGATEAPAGLQPAAREAVHSIRRAIRRPSLCYAGYLDNTRVEATGDLEIGERGSWRSQILGFGSCFAAGPVRGGSLLALRGGTFLIVGCADGLETRVEVGPQASLKVGKVFPGVTLVRGADVRTFLRTERDVVLAD